MAEERKKEDGKEKAHILAPAAANPLNLLRKLAFSEAEALADRQRFSGICNAAVANRQSSGVD
jgi:hypothetical protein